MGGNNGQGNRCSFSQFTRERQIPATRSSSPQSPGLVEENEWQDLMFQEGKGWAGSCRTADGSGNWDPDVSGDVALT